MTNCISEKKFVSLFTCHVYPHRQYRGADDNFKIIFFSQQLIYNYILLKGAGGVPWVQIMENEFECLVVRGGDGGNFAEKFVKKYCS